MDKKKLEKTKEILKILKKQSEELEKLFIKVNRKGKKGHPFSLDGMLIGTIGECLCAALFPLIKLNSNSFKGSDGYDSEDNKAVEIKTTTIGKIRINKNYECKFYLVYINMENLDKEDDWIKIYYFKDGIEINEKNKSLTINEKYINNLKGCKRIDIKN